MCRRENSGTVTDGMEARETLTWCLPPDVLSTRQLCIGVGVRGQMQDCAVKDQQLETHLEDASSVHVWVWVRQSVTDLLQHVQDVHVGLRMIRALGASIDGVQALARTALMCLERRD